MQIINEANVSVENIMKRVVRKGKSDQVSTYCVRTMVDGMVLLCNTLVDIL